MRTASRLDPESSTIGTGDALDALEQDHRRVDTLFARASLTVGAERQHAVDEIIRELTAHATIEEDVVYPAIADAVGGGDMLADGARDDHARIKAVLGRLGKADAGAADVAVVEDLRALQLIVQQHVAIEEGELFPAYRQVATSDALSQLSDAVIKARDAASS